MGLKSRGTDVHHMLFGTGKRKLADEDGLTVHLCRLHHTILHDRGDYKEMLQKEAQMEWQKHYHKSKEDFIARYGKSYI
jgi:hypothetical protein